MSLAWRSGNKVPSAELQINTGSLRTELSMIYSDGDESPSPLLSPPSPGLPTPTGIHSFFLVTCPSLHVIMGVCSAADGYPVDDMNQHEVNELQRGPLGSTTVLTIAPKESSQDLKTVYLERRPLPQPPLKQVRSPADSGRVSALHRSLWMTCGVCADMTA